MRAASSLPLPTLADAIVRTARSRDGYWRAALYLLTRGCGARFLRDRRIWDHVLVDELGGDDLDEVVIVALDFGSMLTEPGWTDAERLMVRAASSLFMEGAHTVGIHEIGHVDPYNRQLLIEAIQDLCSGEPWSVGTEAVLYDYASGPAAVRR